MAVSVVIRGEESSGLCYDEERVERGRVAVSVIIRGEWRYLL